jgi:hypothetical protein
VAGVDRVAQAPGAAEWGAQSEKEKENERKKSLKEGEARYAGWRRISLGLDEKPRLLTAKHSGVLKCVEFVAKEAAFRCLATEMTDATIMRTGHGYNMRQTDFGIAGKL